MTIFARAWLRLAPPGLALFGLWCLGTGASAAALVSFGGVALALHWRRYR